MKMTNPEITEYVMAFVGIVGLLAYFHVTTAVAPLLNALNAAPMVIESRLPTRADARYLDGRVRQARYQARYTDIRV